MPVQDHRHSARKGLDLDYRGVRLLAPGTWTTDATATLARAGVRVARPSARIDHGRLRLQLSGVHLRPGVYRLRVTARHGHARRTILQHTLTIR